MAEADPHKMFNVHDAKTHLSRLLDRAHAGEEIILAKAGEPYAKLVPLRRASLAGSVGCWETFPIPCGSILCLMTNSTPGKANTRTSFEYGLSPRHSCADLVVGQARAA